ncbi:hypothetical protein P9112_014097 [Eukaryota sp. TZLM1-RC]
MLFQFSTSSSKSIDCNNVFRTEVDNDLSSSSVQTDLKSSRFLRRLEKRAHLSRHEYEDDFIDDSQLLFVSKEYAPWSFGNLSDPPPLGEVLVDTDSSEDEFDGEIPTKMTPQSSQPKPSRSSVQPTPKSPDRTSMVSITESSSLKDAIERPSIQSSFEKLGQKYSLSKLEQKFANYCRDFCLFAEGFPSSSRLATRTILFDSNQFRLLYIFYFDNFFLEPSSVVLSIIRTCARCIHLSEKLLKAQIIHKIQDHIDDEFNTDLIKLENEMARLASSLASEPNKLRYLYNTEFKRLFIKYVEDYESKIEVLNQVRIIRKIRKLDIAREVDAAIKLLVPKLPHTNECPDTVEQILLEVSNEPLPVGCDLNPSIKVARVDDMEIIDLD